MESTAAYRLASRTRGDGAMTEFTRGFICGLLEKGEPVSIIAQRLGISEAAVIAVAGAVATEGDAQAAAAVDSPISKSQVLKCLEELRTATVVKEAAYDTMDDLIRLAFGKHSRDAIFNGLLAFLCPDGLPQTPHDVVALQHDSSINAVAKQLLEGTSVLFVMTHGSREAAAVSKTIAVLLKRTSTVDFPHTTSLLIDETLSSLVPRASTAEEAAWVAAAVSIGRRHLALYQCVHGDSDAQRSADYQRRATKLRNELLGLSTKATTQSSSAWVAAAFCATLDEDKPHKPASKHFATTEVREALLRLALTTGKGAPDVVEHVGGALCQLMSMVEGRRCMRCVEVRDAVVAMASTASITPKAGTNLMQLIANMAVSDVSDEEADRLFDQYRWSRSRSEFVLDPALQEFFTRELCDVLMSLLRRPVEERSWFNASGTALRTLLQNPSCTSVAKLFQTVEFRDVLVDLLSFAHHRDWVYGSNDLSDSLCSLSLPIGSRSLPATTTVRDALLMVSRRGDSLRTARVFENITIDGVEGQTLFGTVEVRDALLNHAPLWVETVAFILKLVRNHAANQALFRCVALRDAFVKEQYWSNAAIEVVICLLEGADGLVCNDTATLFGTASVRDAVVSWYGKGDRPTALLLRLLTLLTTNDAGNRTLFATPSIHGLLVQLTATEGCERAVAEVLGNLRHSVEVTFDIDGRVTLGDDAGYVLDGVSTAAPMEGRGKCCAPRLEAVSLLGLERLAGSEGGFLRGAASLHSVVALDALEGWRIVGDGFLRGCASLASLFL